MIKTFALFLLSALVASKVVHYHYHIPAHKGIFKTIWKGMSHPVETWGYYHGDKGECKKKYCHNHKGFFGYDSECLKKHEKGL